MPSSKKEMIYQEEILWKGAPLLLDAVRAENKAFIISGNLIKTASLKNEWQEDVSNPEEVIRTLKESPVKIDLLKFWQRIPETEAKYDYYREWEQIAAIPIHDYKHWWEKQIDAKTRNMVRKSDKKGVIIEETAFSDELARGIMDIFNQSPVRRGKPFRHYGKNFETVKKEMALDLKESVFVTAYHEKELIGFIKLFFTDRYAMITLILDKVAHRDKSPMNGMIAKAVAICAARSVPHLVYTVWRRGEHGKFQESNGFEKIPVPEYFVPLTLKGKLALRLGLHKGIGGLIPEKVMIWLLVLRAKWYFWKYRQKPA